MKPTTRTALAGLLSAFGAALNALAAEIGGGASETATEETPAAPKRRGRPPTAPTTQESTSPTQTTTAETPAASSNGAAEEKETPEDNLKRYEANRALIEPIVKAGNGPAVKAAIAKYSANGLKELAAKDQEAFEKDIEGLSY